MRIIEDNEHNEEKKSFPLSTGSWNCPHKERASRGREGDFKQTALRCAGPENSLQKLMASDILF